MKTRLATTLLILLQAASAQAGSVTTSLAVQAEVLDAGDCTVSASPVNFGQFLPGNANQYGQGGAITVTCHLNQAYQVAVNAGEHYDAAKGTRQLFSGGNLVPYAIYQGQYGTEWGDGNSYAAGQALSGVGTGQAQRIEVLAKVFTTAQARPGSYADNLVVTVNY